MPATPSQRLADVLLGDEGPLERFVRDRRSESPPRPWRLIARDLYERTDIDLVHETLRMWFPDEDAQTSASTKAAG